MLVSLNWLNQYVDLEGISPEDLAEKITKSGIEVDHIEHVAEKHTNVVVGYVVSCQKHPNADKLNLCEVDVGEAENLQIICGAPNVAQGQKVAVAKPGARLPGGVKIKKAKLRGIISNGMICSLQELGLDEKFIPKKFADGIYVFPEDTQIGDPVDRLLNLNDTILDLDLTANRSDCLSMIGVAYEVAAILDRPVKLPEPKVDMVSEKAADDVHVDIEADDLCKYYAAFVIKDVNITASPLWMQNYLQAAGIRPINNVVDITNYVLIEYGQPLHAFDYDRLQSDRILVRRAEDGEKIVTLDDVERTLTSENLLITNGSKPVALAGVMGGANTQVQEDTRTILLEAAYFDPSTVRTTVKATGLRSESSTRFEKGVDMARVKEAGLRACQLLEQYANGKVMDGIVEAGELEIQPVKIELDVSGVNERLGTAIEKSKIEKILQRLQFDFETTGEYFTVYAPSRRGDVHIYEDMLEEIARIYGYDNLPYTLPKGASQAGSLTAVQQLKRKIKRYLQGVGLMETVTYSLTNEENVTQLVSPEVRSEDPKPISVAIPMTEDHRYLRLSILPELLETISYNLARKQVNLAYYEMGSVFITKEETLTQQPLEQVRLSGALCGNWVQNEWQQEIKKTDFYVVKGIVEGLFEYLRLDLEFSPAALPDMHPGRCAVLKCNGKEIGFIGQIHPQLAKEKDLKETYVFDLNLDEIITQHHQEPVYHEISKYPAVTRDVAFVLTDDVLAGDVKKVIEEAGKPLVKQIHVFDVYKGEKLDAGKKSLAYNITFQDPEKTLKDEEVEANFNKIIKSVEEKFAATIRS
ncbi:phenylalanine--tRNA ligase subunit beta [Virgibacillus sp. 179-BFC.A HS]|uniref:Phenylalanine--tRNA ligase beta subunit n=1 Tax=Tigheibacillus jepli TaxID=3035914 RepID=A0ABU5CHW3_9BACI|nr:phenylalanine--tRNA ligase subunit beta [Virgibacillus sp. 179-BFC.A HS]MDY0405404.1 phenylalanine--tRNA ligase subunit beta [Virgibacillus sp. 179-BFC.A HS]